ncbi:protein VACUOLELESS GAMETOPHYTES-like [Bidens hawaiensis]|uniref:protein VACUOLELESS GAMETOPHYTES-like n=1 Tax=Bidens hawaiensis TaxID=980011 RepID=UPI00404AE194
MENLDGNSSIYHFSHKHPLSLQNFPTPIIDNATCLACSLSVADSLYYTCVSCNFYLHKTCSDLPQTLKHPSDQSHDLVLLPFPMYPQGLFKCDACGYHGKGFSYHCSDCQLDLHVACASMPPSITHKAHGHTLGLCFRPPYEKPGFKCDICKQHASNQWLYRCSLCEFDVHIKCPTAKTTSRAILPKSKSLPDSVRSTKPNDFMNNMVGHVVEGIVGSVTQEVIQYVLEGAGSSNN